jgi:Uma2 family endonuclease
MSSAPIRKLTPEEYLEIERQAEFKSQFYRGEMFAMAGASYVHNLIHANLMHRLAERLIGTTCHPVGSDQRVHVPATGLYTYPDVVIVCDPPRFLDGRFDTLLNPKVLFEINSESTEKYDHGTKARNYRQIDSLQEYSRWQRSITRLSSLYQHNCDWLTPTYLGDWPAPP